ncbi:MAG: RNA polymerase sigma factor [Parvibaculaceae bacterium]|nr:RNA polymerase sigma factor [Parvibaculaceae bacterium]HBM89979.1 RNA polymerase sigma factor [Rhodobiaceae bacterium]
MSVASRSSVSRPGDFAAAPRYRSSSVQRRSRKGQGVIPLKTETHKPEGASQDDALMAALADGDPKAGRALVDDHLTHVLAVARRMLGDQAEAEDVAQDTFMRAWKAAGRWEPGRAKLSTWLHRIAMNQCLDRLRKKKPEPLAPDFDAPSDRPDPEAELYQQQLGRRIDGAIQALPERQRAAIVLSHYQHLSNQEASEILGVSVEALESLLSRGRRALKQSLRPEWSELRGEGDPASPDPTMSVKP